MPGSWLFGWAGRCEVSGPSITNQEQAQIAELVAVMGWDMFLAAVAEQMRDDMPGRGPVAWTAMDQAANKITDAAGLMRALWEDEREECVA